MVFDEARGLTVLFGGESNGGFLADTWEWDAAWIERQPTTVPPIRRGNALAYDAEHAETVLFGGTGNDLLADTWVWNGIDWVDKTPVGSPPARFYHSMTYDRARHKVVLFGGIGDLQSGLLADTWEWDGAQWTELTPAVSPPARTGGTLAYDEHRHVNVLFGGYETNDTWEWDGATWTERLPATSPSARGHAATAYFGGAHAVVLFGGGGIWCRLRRDLDVGRRQLEPAGHHPVSTRPPGARTLARCRWPGDVRRRRWRVPERYVAAAVRLIPRRGSSVPARDVVCSAAMGTLTSSPAWKALTEHKRAIEKVHMRELFAKDPERFARMSREACGLFVDYSKHRATDETLELLLALARQQDVEGWRDRMFAGDKTQRHRGPRGPARRAAQPQRTARSSSTART